MLTGIRVEHGDFEVTAIVTLSNGKVYEASGLVTGWSEFPWDGPDVASQAEVDGDIDLYELNMSVLPLVDFIYEEPYKLSHLADTRDREIVISALEEAFFLKLEAKANE